MKLRDVYIKKLGKKKFAKLSKTHRDHIRRIDSLPKPKIVGWFQAHCVFHYSRKGDLVRVEVTKVTKQK